MTSTETRGEMRTRVRIGVERTATKGYVHSTTVELEWLGDEDDAAMDDRLAELLADADMVARREIRARMRRDAMDAATALAT